MSNQGKAKQDTKLPRVLFIPTAKRTLMCVIAYKNRVRLAMGEQNETESEVLAKAQRAKPMTLDCETLDVRYVESWNGRAALIYTDDKGRVLCGSPKMPRMDPASALDHLSEQLARFANTGKQETKPEAQKNSAKK